MRICPLSLRLGGSGIPPDGNPQASPLGLTFLVLTPPLKGVMSVYFTHLSQSLTGEAHWSLLPQVFHEEVLYGCRRVVGFGVSVATAGEGVQV